MKLFTLIEHLLLNYVKAAARAPQLCIALLIGITIVFSFGLPRLSFETNLLDWLPQTKEVLAFDRLINEVDGVTNQELLWLELTPSAKKQGVTSITHEKAIRAQAELADFVTNEIPEIRYSFGIPQWMLLATSITQNIQDGEATLPKNSLQFQALWQGIWRTQGELLENIIAKDNQSALLGFVIEGDPLSPENRAMGHRLLQSFENYKKNEKTYDLLKIQGPVGLASGISRIDLKLQEDARWMIPLAALTIFLCLLIAFRSVYPSLIAMLSLAMGFIWTLGFMGFANIGINIVNLALFPLLLGSGIDYAIHVLKGYKSTEQAAPFVKRTGVALVITTLISIFGLLSLSFSGISGLAELGILSSFGLLSLILIVLSLCPAAYALHSPRQTQLQGGLFNVLLKGFSGSGRWLALVFLTGIIIFIVINPRELSYQVDVIQGNFPAKDNITQTLEQVRVGVAGALPEFILFDGPITPELISYTTKLATKVTQGLGPNTNIIDLSLMTGSYESLKDGLGPATRKILAANGSLRSIAPQEVETLQDSLTAMHNSNVWAPLAKLVSSNPDNKTGDFSAMIVMPDVTKDNPDELAAIQDLSQRLSAAITALEADKPASVEVSFLGYRTMSQLFLESSFYWLKVLFVVCFITAIVLIALYTRSIVAVLAVATITALAGLLWFNLLGYFDIPMSIFLLFPTIFIASIGSDYAIHLIIALKNEAQDSVYKTVGEAVFLAALTDALVFGLFALAYLVGIQQMMIATVLGVGSSLLLTLLIIPLVAKRLQTKQLNSPN